MKSLTVKQAEKWIDRLKTDNPTAFKEIIKQLKKFQKTNDQHECFIKINEALLEHPDLTKDLNMYLEDANKFIVNRTEVQRINDLVKYVKKIRPQTFEEIVGVIRDLSNKKSEKVLSEEDQNKILKEFILQRAKGHPELENYAEKALNYSAEQMIRKLDLSHLAKTSRQTVSQIKEQESVDVGRHSYSVVAGRQQEPIFQQVKPKTRFYPPFLNSNEEKLFIRNLETQLEPGTYKEIIKVIQIFRVGIITRSEALQLLKPFSGTEYAGIKDIIETRQNDRRRYYTFKPLNDTDFTNAERATRSYVNMPPTYPNICSGSKGNALSQEVLNRHWVSVPIGSEDQFNLRVRNNFEENLIKAEDDRYQIDLNLKRMKKSIELLEQIVSKLTENATTNVQILVEKAINFGVIQYVYKSATKEQKNEIEYYFKHNTLQICQVMIYRLGQQLSEISEIRNIHGIRNWSQIASKNWNKSLDFKGHEFKRTQKLKMKPQVFLDELKTKVDYLEKKGLSKESQTYFEDKKDFFSVFNSFETSSRKQKCLNRKFQTPQSYNISEYSIPTRLPAMILAFEDKRALNLALSYIFFYINNGTNESDKTKCNYIMRLILPHIFGINSITHKKLNMGEYNQEKFLNALTSVEKEQKSSSLENNWIEENDQELPLSMEPIQLPSFLHEKGSQDSEYDYLPKKTAQNLVFYASQNFYYFLRFLYAIYERIIRLFQISEEDSSKPMLFQTLYFLYIKSKENAKFEDYLNILFTKNAFMFTTFYKLIEGFIKSVSTLANCPITNYSLKLLPSVTHEDIYLLLINKYYLINNINNPKILRFTYYGNSSHLLYINTLQSFYKPDEQNKELIKRRNDINHKIETYTIMRDFVEWEMTPEMIGKNRMEYYFEGNTIKLMNMGERQDILVNEKYKSEKRCRMAVKKYEREIYKLKMMNDYIG